MPGETPDPTLQDQQLPVFIGEAPDQSDWEPDTQPEPTAGAGDVVPVDRANWTPAMHRRAAEAAGNIVIGPKGVENRPQFVHPGQIGQTEITRVAGEEASDPDRGDTYDHLFSDQEDPRTPQEAIRQAGSNPKRQSVPPAQTSHRPNYWRPPTQAQIDATDARADGIDLRLQEKYYPPGQRSE